MQTAIHLDFSNIPRSLTRTIQPSKHGHRLQKALLLTVPEHLERVAYGPQPDPSGRSAATEPSGKVASMAANASAAMAMRITPVWRRRASATPPPRQACQGSSLGESDASARSAPDSQPSSSV
jgi:hypothetical protein